MATKTISALIPVDPSFVEKKSAKRRTRGAQPRGPRPKVCDLCQLRKVKCSMELPRCQLCQRLNKPCTYDRKGFTDDTQETQVFKPQKANKDGKMIMRKMQLVGKEMSFVRTILVSSLLASNRSRIMVDGNGSYIYSGPSIAIGYYTSNANLLSSLARPFVHKIESVPQNPNLDVEMTTALTLQLVELYFAYLNQLYPIVDPTTFYSQLNSGCKDNDFLALLNVICLAGASYYPNRTLGRIMAVILTSRLDATLKRIYLKPSINAIQACLLISYHISVCSDQAIIQYAWFILGTAKLMCQQLGFPYTPKNASIKRKDLACRIWWLVIVVEVLTAQCCGRPLSESTVAPEKMRAELPLPSVNFTYPSLFLVKSALKFNIEHNSDYHCGMNGHVLMMQSRLQLRDKYEPFNIKKLGITNWNDGGMNDLAFLSPYFRHSMRIETKAIFWYLNLPLFTSPLRYNNVLYLPSPNDLHLSTLSILFYSFLVDLNKPFMDTSQPVSEFPPLGRGLNIERFLISSPLEKCILASFFGCQVFINSGIAIFETGVPFVWYCALQFIFIFLLIHKDFPEKHWSKGPAKRNALFIFDKMEKNADRWAIIRDIYFFIKPFIEAIKNSD